MTPEGPSRDLAGAAYWDGIWRRTTPRALGRLSHFHGALAHVLDRFVRPGDRVCEVGCADSMWVPHLVRRGADTWGLDYSEPGLARLRARLAAQRLHATLIAADLLADDPFEGATFDMMFSLGLIEHFREPAVALGAMVRALRPGGLLMTMIPNLVGLWGTLQRRLDRSVFDLHVPHDVADLDAMHTALGLETVEAARYFGLFGVLLLHRPSFAERHPRVNHVAVAAQWVAQQSISWPLQVTLGDRANTRALSSHIVGVYRRPSAAVVA